MKTGIYARLRDMPIRFREDATDRILETLGRTRHRIAKVSAFFQDENGPRGGIGIRCRVVLDTERMGLLVATARAGDAETALDEALQRVRSRVRRSAERRVTRSRDRATRRERRRAA